MRRLRVREGRIVQRDASRATRLRKSSWKWFIWYLLAPRRGWRHGKDHGVEAVKLGVVYNIVSILNTIERASTRRSPAPRDPTAHAARAHLSLSSSHDTPRTPYHARYQSRPPISASRFEPPPGLPGSAGAAEPGGTCTAPADGAAPNPAGESSPSKPNGSARRELLPRAPATPAPDACGGTALVAAGEPNGSSSKARRAGSSPTASTLAEDDANVALLGAGAAAPLVANESNAALVSPLPKGSDGSVQPAGVGEMPIAAGGTSNATSDELKTSNPGGAISKAISGGLAA